MIQLLPRNSNGLGVLLRRPCHLAHPCLPPAVHTSAALLDIRTRNKKLRKYNPFKEAKERYGHLLKRDAIVPTSPLTGTDHPVGVADLEAEEERLAEEIRRVSEPDRPLQVNSNCEVENPYAREPRLCVLCPKRYSVPIRPYYKNPKLLAQFVSPHTGLPYKAHITGLCADMQKEMEIEVKKAQALGERQVLIRLNSINTNTVTL